MYSVTTDARLRSGSKLKEAVEAIDEKTGGAEQTSDILARLQKMLTQFANFLQQFANN